MSNYEKNIDPQELLGKISAGSEPPTKAQIEDFISRNLSPEQAASVRSILGDESKTKAILNSDAARAIFEKFFGGKNNGGI